MERGLETGDFQLVRKKGRRAHKPGRPQGGAPPLEGKELDACKLQGRISTAREALEKSPFLQECMCLLEERGRSSREVVCYGIGRIGLCYTSRLQLALLLRLVDLCQPEKVWLFDPVLSEVELSVVRGLGISIIPQNEMCKRSVSVPTLFYMIHCGKAMYNHLLWANWNTECLGRTAIIGNSFSSYSERMPARQLQEEAPYIYSISPYCCELSFPQSFHDPNVFNDTSLHIFPPPTLLHAPSTMWVDPPEPQPDPSDPEIIATPT